MLVGKIRQMKKRKKNKKKRGANKWHDLELKLK